jgi:putative transposase
MNPAHAMEAVRYIENHPVVVKIVRSAWAYPWSSAKAHVKGEDDGLIRGTPLVDRVEDWKKFLREGVERELVTRLKKHERTDRPLGDARFVERIEKKACRSLAPKKAEWPKKARN